ncbi:MAG: type VI secretion system tip protein VgrG [Deltaproteobacteria bacterium]|nr:type VI secretion system tip protein VgrG [Deltaproteobacteria bacterium]
MTKASQKDRTFKVTTSLGKDVLLFYRMNAREELGGLFSFAIELLSTDSALDITRVLGQGMTVSTPLPKGGTRDFHGIVSRFKYAGTQGGFAKYEATLVPWFWCLTRTADCRIFQKMTAPEIIKKVFRDHGFTDFADKLSGKYVEREYCVQYRESDFSFVSRLMEQEGIYYYFQHAKGKHSLCLSDNYGSHGAVSGYAKIPYFPPDRHGRRERDHVYDWAVTQEVSTGTVALNDYDFENPKADLLVKSVVKQRYTHGDFEIYDYPGEYLKTSDGENYARTRIEESHASYERVEGIADAAGLQVGALFRLEGYPRRDQNREYLVVSTDYELVNNEYETGVNEGEGISRKVRFNAMESRVPFRSPRKAPSPIVQGPQTAIVVGKKGEEIWTDKYGRVKVQFHWDRLGKKDENSSCWVRVSQAWAGKTWGAMHIPRIGQEVIVEFLEGDPDRPIITGRVFNAVEMPPYTLPKNQTKSGFKSRSTKKANEKNFSELSFDDKKGQELVYFHAEKDFERVVENNDSLKVGLDGKDDGDQKIEIHNNQTLIVGNKKSKTGTQTITIWKDLKETIKTGDETVTIEKGSRKTTIKNDDTLTLKSGDHTIKISAGKSLIQAAKSIELKVGPSSIKIDPSGITLKSTKIQIKGDAKVDVEAPMTSCKGTGQLTLKGGITMIN